MKNAPFKKALAHFSATDPLVADLIVRVGPCLLEVEAQRTPFQSLVRAVANQQLNGKAATTILGRFCGLFPGSTFPAPEALATVTDDQLRGVGFSWAKVRSIRDLAEKTLLGVVPGPEEIGGLSDDEIVERLVKVRGVGRWTVEMMLIFQLGRMDVWPVDDFGVRHGYRLLMNEEEMPKPKNLQLWGEKFRPFRTLLAWYLWRGVDLSRQAKPA